MIHTLLVCILSVAISTPQAAETPPTSLSSAADTQGARDAIQIAEPVAPGVTLLRQAQTNFYGVVGNVVVIEQSDGMVLVDSGASYGSGRRVVEHVRRISAKPVKSVIITHWHNDHPLGLSAIVEAWPDVQVIASAQAARDFDAQINPLIPRGAPDPAYNANRFLPLLAEVTANSTKADMPEAMRQGYLRAAELVPFTMEDHLGTYVVEATTLLSDDMILADAERPIEIMQLGRGNTDGDLIVWLPRQRIVAAGDVVVAPLPYLFNVYPREWVGVLERLKAMPFDVLIPGHGELQRDRAYLDRLIGLQRAAEAAVSAEIAAGRTREQIEEGAAALLADQRRVFVGEDPWLGLWFDGYSAEPLIASVYTELTGATLGSPPRAP